MGLLGALDSPRYAARMVPAPPVPVVLLHNPRCSKSRAALALLQDAGGALEVRNYLEDPLDAAELETLRSALGLPVREWVRMGDPAFAEAGGRQDLGDEELLELLAREPRALQRPIVIQGARAAVARPPFDLATWLEGA